MRLASLTDELAFVGSCLVIWLDTSLTKMALSLVKELMESLALVVLESKALTLQSCRLFDFLTDFFLWMRHSSSGCSFEKALCAKVHRLPRGGSQRLHPARETGRRTPEGARTSARPS